MGILRLEEVDSTNNYLKENYHELDNFTICVTNNQTSGRGRYDRIWFGDIDSLMFSILLKNQNVISIVSSVSMIIAASICKVLNKYHEGFKIKWPNDIYYKDKKIVGILPEAKLNNYYLDYLIIGIGINVNQEKLLLDDIAVSLFQITKEKIDKDKLLIEIINQFKSDLDNTLISNKDLINYINNNFYLKNKEVEFIYNNKPHKGISLGVDENLNILILEDKINAYCSGEMNLKKRK